MTDAVLSMAEYNRFSKGIFSWVGFKTKWFDYENIERVAGTTKWNFWGLFKYSIEGIVGFSTTPLLIAAGVGVLFCILAFIGIIFVIVRALMFGDPTSGWPSMVCSGSAPASWASTWPRLTSKSSTAPSTFWPRPRKINNAYA